MAEAGYLFMAVLLAGGATWAVVRLVLDWQATAWRRRLHRESLGEWRLNRRVR